jgi:4Fe-4S binding domain
VAAERYRLLVGVVTNHHHGWGRPVEQWGPWFLFALFYAILVWEEVWRLNDTAYLSAWLLIIITAGAMICSAFFERRLWCRYLCPIGGMNGLFAKASMTELRGREGVCSGTFKTTSTPLYYFCFLPPPLLLLLFSFSFLVLLVCGFAHIGSTAHTPQNR